MQNEFLQVWLNKIEVMADLADGLPNEKFMMMIDAALPERFHTLVEKLVEIGLNIEPNDQTLWARMYPEMERRTWFGKKQCTQPPLVSAAVLGFQSHASKHVRKEYRKQMSELFNKTAEVGDCPCYDEETVLSSIYSKGSLLNINFIESVK